MFVDTADFLLLVPVPVLLPRLPHLCHRGRCSNWSTAWFITHDRLNPPGQRSDVLLKTDTTHGASMAIY